MANEGTERRKGGGHMGAATFTGKVGERDI